jgi:hypothetical protein
MSITSLTSQNENKFSTIATYVLGVIGIGLTVYFGGEFIKRYGGVKRTAGLTVAPAQGQQDVFVNDQLIGLAPLEATNIKPGQNKVSLRSGNRQYETQINFLPNDPKYFFTVGMFRDLGTSDTFSSGQDIWYENDDANATIRIISDPSGAQIFLDKTQIGTTPFVSSSISEGSYDIRVEQAGYESQTLRINVKKGYTLNAQVKLFPMPVPPKPALVSGQEILYDLSSSNPIVTSETINWALSVPYWTTTRGVEMETGKKQQAEVFDFMVDYKGNIFDSKGTPVVNKEDFDRVKNAKRGAYLGRTIDGATITKEAQEALALIGSGGTTTNGSAGKVRIASTPTGWLRVRNAPSTAGTEVGKVNTGEIYTVVEEAPGWKKIKVTEALQGWVSADYVTAVQ